MNKRILILFVLLFSTSWFYAQSARRDRIKALKIAFISERVNLTTKESQSFWPIYNEYEKTLQSIRKQERIELKSKTAAAESLSASEASKILDKLLAIQKEKHMAEQDFISKIRNVISPKKTLLLLKAEEDFKKRLLQQMRKRRSGG